MMDDNKRLLDFDYVKSALRYDPETGHFFWKPKELRTRGDAVFNGKFAGKRAGSLSGYGYRTICFSFGSSKNVVTSEHRLAVSFNLGRMLDEDEIVDHINGVRYDNRMENLRLVDSKGNARNCVMHTTNSSGCKGVFYVSDKRGSKKWRAQISLNNKTKFVGYFATKEDAARAYDAAAVLHYGECAKTNEMLGTI